MYSFSTTSNAEIRLRFYELALKDPASAAAKEFAFPAAKWVVGDDGTGIVKGRMKFCRPIFRAVCRVDKNIALGVFGGKKDEFHPIARKLIEKVCYMHLFVVMVVLTIIIVIISGSWNGDMMRNKCGIL